MSSLFQGTRCSPLVRVAVERGLDAFPEGLLYLLPPELGKIRAGDRVVVPLGRGDSPTAGYVVERLDSAEALESRPSVERLKPVLRRDPGGVSLPPVLLDLARWVSAYYVCPVGLTLSSMLPAAVKRQVGVVSRMMVDLPPEESPGAAEEPDPAPLEGTGGGERSRRLPPKQAAVIAHLRALPDHERPVEAGELAAAVGLGTRGPIDALLRRGLLRASRRSTVEARWEAAAQLLAARTGEPMQQPELTEEQRRALNAIGPEPAAHLLFGVTGSGKTEVYLRLIDRTLAAGKVALVLVPEIALTPQSGGRVVARFPNHRVAILHSGLTAAQRHVNWTLVAEGGADVILGARSAVFAPIQADRLGLIVVDEEHDASYKQEQAPRYNGRDVALKRAQLEGCPIVLGSATPALESWHNATVSHRFALHRLTRRAPGLTVPRIELVDFVEERRRRSTAGDRRVHLIGPRLEGAIAECLRGDGQALLLLNRRGWGNYIACPDRACGWLLECDHCDATMVCHLDPRSATGRYVRCHHCQAEKLLPGRCPRCENRLTVFGFGTQRVEEELQDKFPSLVPDRTMLRVDADTMGSAGDLHRALSRFADGSVRLLLGTQMIAKGLDFPGVRLVGVINADTAISLPDFRAAERTFQLVAQVSGRCGRGADPGVAVIQTFNPALPVMQLAARGDYVGFANAELEERSRCGLPPSTRLARIVVRHADPEACASAARVLAEDLRHLAASQDGAPAVHGSDGAIPPGSVRVRGPAPCVIPRIADRHRQQVELLASSPAPIQRLLAAARSQGVIRLGELMQVDVDPIGG